MEPLSDMLALLKPQTYVSAGLNAAGAWAIQFPAHAYIKFNAVTQGCCWIAVEGGGEPQKLEQGDCFLLPSGRPFVLASDLSLPRMSAETVYTEGCDRTGICHGGGEFSLVGARFEFAGEQAHTLFASLPAVVSVRESSDQASVLRWSIDRFKREIQQRDPGASLIAEHLAHIMLIQVLRLHVTSKRSEATGWLAAMADPQLCAALAAMHGDISRRWSLDELGKAAGMSRSGFASRFKQVAGISPMDYLARSRMHIAADRLRTTSHIILSIANSVGYDSDAAFSTAFKKAMGQSPRKYRRTPALRRTEPPVGQDAFGSGRRSAPPTPRPSLGIP